MVGTEQNPHFEAHCRHRAAGRSSSGTPGLHTYDISERLEALIGCISREIDGGIADELAKPTIRPATSVTHRHPSTPRSQQAHNNTTKYSELIQSFENLIKRCFRASATALHYAGQLPAACRSHVYQIQNPRFHSRQTSQSRVHDSTFARSSNLRFRPESVES